MGKVITQNTIPKTWKIFQLSDIANIIMGQSPSSSSYNNLGEGLPFFQGKADFDNNFRTRIRYWTSMPTKLSEPMDILMSVRAPVGDVAINDHNACIGRGLAAIRANKAICSQRFLFQKLLSLKTLLNKKAQGSTFTAISGPELKKIVINLPSIVEQEKIAEILSSIDNYILKTEKILLAIDELKLGLMQQIFSNNNWPLKKISEIANVVTGGTPNTSIKEYWDGDVPWMSSGEVNNRRIYNTEKKITKLGLDNSNAQILPVETIMLALAGQGKTRGKVAILKTETTCNQSLAGIIVNQKIIDNEFLFFNLEYRYKELRSVSGGEGRAGLNLRLINNIEVPVPVLNTQKIITQTLNAIDKKIIINLEIKNNLVLLKSGLMKDLLCGKVLTISQ